jgi:hypothetical protein
LLHFFAPKGISRETTQQQNRTRRPMGGGYAVFFGEISGPARDAQGDRAFNDLRRFRTGSPGEGFFIFSPLKDFSGKRTLGDRSGANQTQCPIRRISIWSRDWPWRPRRFVAGREGGIGRRSDRPTGRSGNAMRRTLLRGTRYLRRYLRNAPGSVLLATGTCAGTNGKRQVPVAVGGAGRTALERERGVGVELEPPDLRATSRPRRVARTPRTRGPR